MKRLNELTDSDLIELKIILISCSKNYLGISNLPDEHDLKIMCDFLTTHFKDFTAHEIKLALSMYANGQISCQNQIYGVLSMKFLSDVLQEYRMHRKMANDLNKIKSQNQILLNEHQVNQDEKNENLYNWITKYVIENNYIPELYAWNECYFHLEKIGEIDLTNDDKIDFRELCKNEISERIKYLSQSVEHREQVNELMKILSSDFALASFCRKKLVLLHLQKLINPQIKNQNHGNNE